MGRPTQRENSRVFHKGKLVIAPSPRELGHDTLARSLKEIRKISVLSLDALASEMHAHYPRYSPTVYRNHYLPLIENGVLLRGAFVGIEPSRRIFALYLDAIAREDTRKRIQDEVRKHCPDFDFGVSA